MPTYLYRCEKCGHEEQPWLKPSEAGPVRYCPKCDEVSLVKAITAPAGFQLKGGGWYATDYKNR